MGAWRHGAGALLGRAQHLAQRHFGQFPPTTGAEVGESRAHPRQQRGPRRALHLDRAQAFGRSPCGFHRRLACGAARLHRSAAGAPPFAQAEPAGHEHQKHRQHSQRALPDHDAERAEHRRQRVPDCVGHDQSGRAARSGHRRAAGGQQRQHGRQYRQSGQQPDQPRGHHAQAPMRGQPPGPGQQADDRQRGRIAEALDQDVGDDGARRPRQVARRTVRRRVERRIGGVMAAERDDQRQGRQAAQNAQELG